MNVFKTAFRIGAAALALGCALGAQAQTFDVQFKAAGSSAMVNTFAQAYFNTNPNSLANFKIFNGASSGNHTIGGPPVTKGTIWIAVFYDNARTTYTVAYYLGVDSTVGVRAFFNSETVNLNAAGINGEAAGSVIGTIPAASNVAGNDADIQAAVTAINSSTANRTINVGATDITPADAKTATLTALNRLHYDNNLNPIKGLNKDGTLGSVGVYDFSLSARAFTPKVVGAAPILVCVNKSLPGAGHFGDPNLTNINRFVLSGFLDGSFNVTRDAFATSGGALGSFNAITFVRENLSGTYNTMEYCIPASAEIGSTMNTGIGGNPPSPNPLNEASYAYTGVVGGDSAAGAGRVRALGTGAMLALANNSTHLDCLTWGFWSFANYKGLANLKYLTVDGVEPLYATYAANPGGAGVPPQAGTAAPTHDNIKNGTYPIWSMLRTVFDTSDHTTIVSNVVGTATNLDSGGDYVPANNMNVFRSHRIPTYTSDPNPHNGLPGTDGNPENGGDAGGAVLTIQADQDFYNNNFFELVNLRQ